MRIWFEASAVKRNFVFRKTAAVDLLLRESHHMPEHIGHIVVHLLGSSPGFLKCSSGKGFTLLPKTWIAYSLWQRISLQGFY
jgi:hypothetical protein